MKKKPSTDYTKAETTKIAIRESDEEYGKKLNIGVSRTCKCPRNHLNCMSPKEWLKSQLGVWQFFYESRDIRDKKLHPATFPISLSKKIIELFTHEGELVLDPFVGSGTTLVAAADLNRNAIGFDLQESYIKLCERRLTEQKVLFNNSRQVAIKDDARNIYKYIEPNSVSLIWTSPPYANLLTDPEKTNQEDLEIMNSMARLNNILKIQKTLESYPWRNIPKQWGIYLSHFSHYSAQNITV